MDYVPGPMSDEEEAFSFRKNRFFILAWTFLVVCATIVIEQAFEEGGALVGGGFLAAVLFILFAILWLAPEYEQ